MRRNSRHSTRMTVIAATTVHVAAVIVALFAMVIVNMLARSSCDHLMKSQGEKERKLARLQDAYTRESDRWESMKSPEKLEARLLKLGMAMRTPKPDQIVRMDGEGRPLHGQRSVARAQSRSITGQSAKIMRRR